MKFAKLKLKALLIATLFSVVLVSIALFIDKTYSDWADEVTNTNMVLCEVLVKQLSSASKNIIDSLDNAKFFEEGFNSRIETGKVDLILSHITTENLEPVKGMEGGFYFIALEQFQGYAYPTSPPPIPVYGPPPRSYNMIKEQTLNSIIRDSLIVQIHQFDPAIFPLATQPIKSNGKIIGAVWVRTHIERELPQLNLVDILNIVAVLSLLGFILAVAMSIQQNKRLDTIKQDIEYLEVQPSHRLKELPGIFGFITDSINKMVDALQTEHKHREHLEHELHQKDKMASLGTLIAGVAHEVKTPLAIIKTRVQMWQQKLKTSPERAKYEELISYKSLQMVINEINRLSTLVNRLLIFSRPIDENFKSCDINRLIGDVLTLFKTKRYSSIAKITFDPDIDLPKTYIDPNKIEQVILNIITNSFESIESDGNIEIKTYRENENIIIFIQDNGCGIPENAMKNIFDPFFTTKTSGTGLGLSIAYEIIKAHNGTIEFESVENEYSKFVIKLPFEKMKLKKE